MKKILKRLLISTALITPIAVSAPLLLTSCSVEENTSETGPSIFNQSYGPIKLVKKSESNGNLPTGYYLSTIIENDAIQNDVFKNVLKTVPQSPKFVDLATPVASLFQLDLKEVESPNLPNIPGGSEQNKLENKINYSSFEAKNQTLDTNKINAITNIFSTLWFVCSDDNSDDNIISAYPWSAFDLKKHSQDITYDVNYTVSQGTIENNGAIETYFMLSDISFTFKLKDNTKKWAGLETGDPIFVSILWAEGSKGTLFKKGFESIPKTTGSDSDKTINFTGNLNPDVFGNDKNKIDKTDKIKQWFEGKTGNSLTGSGNNSIGSSGLVTANKTIASKIKNIFENTTTVTNPGVETSSNAKKQITLAKDQLTSTFIKGVSEVATSKSNYERANPPSKLGSENIDVSISQISKSAGASANDKKFDIELTFKLVNDNSPGWYGLTDDISRLPIKFILSVDLSQQSK